MGDNKDVLKNTEIKDSDLEDKKGVVEEGSTEVFGISVDAVIVEPAEVETINDKVEDPIQSNEPKSIALIEQEEKILNSVEVITLEKMRVFAKEVVKSGVSPFKREADVLVVLVRGKELGLPYATSVNNIFAINGKTGLSVHLHKALLTKAGVYFELTEDYVPVYAFGKMVDNKFVPVGTTTSTKVDGFQVSPAVIDRQTTYYFEREVRMPLSGKVRTKKVTISFKYSEAVKAELTGKEVWKKYDRSLMKARAFTLGSSEIASDVIQGMYSINELAMEFGKKFTINENLEERIIGDEEVTMDTEYQEV